MPETARGHVSGFVSILGRPNSGKSTLLNALVGTKLAIVTAKPQTTRALVQGVLTLPNAQIVFLDTPGIHEPDTLLNRRMMDSIRAALDERDLLLFLADASRPFGEKDEDAVRLIASTRAPVLLLLNKVDRVKDKAQLLPLIERYKAAYEFADYFPISALKSAGLDELRAAILARLPEGPAYFPPDYLTDQPERYLAAELVREKILAETQRGGAARGGGAGGFLGGDSAADADLRHHLRGAGGPEGDPHRRQRVDAETDRHAGARRDGGHVRAARSSWSCTSRYSSRWRENPAFLEQLDWHSMAGKTD